MGKIRRPNLLGVCKTVNPSLEKSGNNALTEISSSYALYSLAFGQIWLLRYQDIKA